MGLPGGATSRHNEVQSQVAFDSRQSAGGATNALSLKLAQLLHPHAGMGAHQYAGMRGQSAKASKTVNSSIASARMLRTFS